MSRVRLIWLGVHALAALSIQDAGADTGRVVAEDAPALSAQQILQRAFRNRYECDTRQIIELTVRNAFDEVLYRRLEAASKRINGRFHGLGRFTAPSTLRGTLILTIENSRRSDDHFLYLPSLQRVRRVTSAQRADSFLGTDLSYEDFERREVDDYEAELRLSEIVDGEAVYVVLARPLFESGYDRLKFMIAVSDFAILETRYYKRGAGRPFKLIRAPRMGMQAQAGHVLPIWIEVQNLERGTETEVRIHRLTVNPQLDDSLFTAAWLERGRPIPGLEP